MFEKPLAKALKRSDGSKGGVRRFPAVLLFKIRMLQAL
uniref:IS4 family transposase n=1 Tax=Rhizobium meliloti TaxID=382 RepID=I2E191_RHIML|nr:IS4 family transposase [Sinorhizobium meliloti]